MRSISLLGAVANGSREEFGAGVGWAKKTSGTWTGADCLDVDDGVCCFGVLSATEAFAMNGEDSVDRAGVAVTLEGTNVGAGPRLDMLDSVLALSVNSNYTNCEAAHLDFEMPAGGVELCREQISRGQSLQRRLTSMRPNWYFSKCSVHEQDCDKTVSQIEKHGKLWSQPRLRCQYLLGSGKGMRL